MLSLVVIGLQVKEKQRGAQLMCPPQLIGSKTLNSVNLVCVNPVSPSDASAVIY